MLRKADSSTDIIRSSRVAMKQTFASAGNADVVLAARYLMKDEQGNVIESPNDLFRRVANAIASASAAYGADEETIQKESNVYNYMMSDKIFLPNSPTLMNAGRPLGQLSACFVIPVEDSMDSIFQAVKDAAIIHKTGGGTGFSFSSLRPKNDVVMGTSGVSSGPVSFMSVFNAATETIKQGGKRRGANMGVLRVDHPDILEFVACKNDGKSFSNFNISVAITNEFMNKVIGADDNTMYNLINPHKGEIAGMLDAHDVFRAIVENAHKTGDPGIVFIDTINESRWNIVKHLGTIEATNPCVTGETKILTRYGHVRIDELVGRNVDVWNGEEWSTVTPFVSGYDKDILRVEFTNGAHIDCTENHVFYVGDGYKTTAKELRDGASITDFWLPDGENIVSGVRIKSVMRAGTADTVYCLTEPKRHMACFNGILTGQCGEQPLLPLESCNLNAINLDRLTSPSGEFDYSLFEIAVRIGTRFLDNVIDVNLYPLKSIETMTKTTRKIGLGVMGLADSLIKQRIRYDSEDGVEFGRNIMEMMQSISHDESEKLAGERGAFPAYREDCGVTARRNAATTTVAPTGTISIIASCSSGIEPLFDTVYTRHVLDGSKLEERHPMIEIIENEMGKKKARGIFRIANEISYDWHIRMQAAFQENVDSAVSKTINMKSDATEDEIAAAYKMAYEHGLKGITVYRDKSKEGQVLNHKAKGKDVEKIDVDDGDTKAASAIESEPTDVRTNRTCERDRPDITTGETERIHTGCGKLYVTVNNDGGGLCEVFCTMGRSGGCTSSQSEAISRLISLALIRGISVEDIVHQLKGIRCPSPAWHNGRQVLSCADGVAMALMKYVGSNGKVRVEMAGECPDCGGKLEYGEGCVACKTCGYSKC